MATNPLKLSEANNLFAQIRLTFNPSSSTLCVFWNPKPRPSFNFGLLRELESLQGLIKDSEGCVLNEGEIQSFNFILFTSEVPKFFNLGGDLELFARCVRDNDKDTLLEYAELCVNVLYGSTQACYTDKLTVALVCGDALGGGFESALSGNILIAERSARMGTPEILFNLFPGMGAYTYLARRVSKSKALEMILSGRVYEASELYDLGVVDVLAEDGDGQATAELHLKRLSKSFNGTSGMLHAVMKSDPISLDELMGITHTWVDYALNLTERDLKMMQRLVKAQNNHSDK